MMAHPLMLVFESSGTVSMTHCTTTCTDVSMFVFFDDWVKLHTVLL